MTDFEGYLKFIWWLVKGSLRVFHDLPLVPFNRAEVRLKGSNNKFDTFAQQERLSDQFWNLPSKRKVIQCLRRPWQGYQIVQAFYKSLLSIKWQTAKYWIYNRCPIHILCQKQIKMLPFMETHKFRNTTTKLLHLNWILFIPSFTTSVLVNWSNSFSTNQFRFNMNYSQTSKYTRYSL